MTQSSSTPNHVVVWGSNKEPNIRMGVVTHNVDVDPESAKDLFQTYHQNPAKNTMDVTMGEPAASPQPPWDPPLEAMQDSPPLTDNMQNEE